MLKKKFNATKNWIHVISLSCNPVPPPNYGGIELVIANLCEGFVKLGAKVKCYSPGELSLQGVVHIQTLKKPSTLFKEGGEPNTQEHLNVINIQLQKNLVSGDIVIFNHVAHYRFLRKRLGIFNWLKANFYEIAHCIDAGMQKNIIYPSQALADTLGKPGVVIPHGVDLLLNNAPDLQQREEALFYAGAVYKEKGVHIALEACKRLGVKLVIAGPHDKDEYAQIILSDANVQYLGVLSAAELYDAYSRYKALVYMTQLIEPFGLAVIEAMAAGTPVITSGKGGTGETVINGVTGFIVDTAEDIVLAYAKINTISNKRCVARAKEYSIDVMTQKYFNFLTNNNKKTNTSF